MKKPPVLIVGLIVALLIISTAANFLKQRTTRSQPQTLMDARAAFKNVILPLPKTRPYFLEDPLPPYQKITYPSPAGDLAAYLTKDPGDGKKHPAIVWAHGGFAGIGRYYCLRQPASNDQTPRAFVDAGFVVMLPSWRGENENPGQREFFYGEINDAVAAIDFLGHQSYVDPDRLYMVGHSTGGIVVLLTAEASPKLRAAFSIGGIAEITETASQWESYYGGAAFDFKSKEECRVRSAINFVESLRVPVFYFEGKSSSNWSDIPAMQRRADRAGTPFHSFIISGGGHRDILRPITTLLAKKLQQDAGPTFRIDLNQDEIQAALRAQEDRIQAAAKGPKLTVTDAARGQFESIFRMSSQAAAEMAITIDIDQNNSYLPGVIPATAVDPARRLQIGELTFQLPRNPPPGLFPLTIDYSPPPNGEGFIYLPTGQE